ncbi:N-terminal phage integrase SAM-like domain-containing protein [Nonomuraea polychroma]|uniref:N-terminal phage integrase SAM-like domain-containing protein n=1 Tax=Nonomuraea polychroma TaxID=46176 RepID=UPI0019D42EDD|nr:N-terminal phage integrase SAM-like domain-containing protein [Nonomuraea polychroma]
MANKPGKRRFGSIRQLPSGRFQIRYPGPDGKIRLGETTYARERDAEKALSLIEAKLITGDWTDPQRAKVKLGDYADKWIRERTNLRPRTVEIYKGLLKRYIRPHLGGVPIGKVDTAAIREWRVLLLGNGVGPSGGQGVPLPAGRSHDGGRRSDHPAQPVPHSRRGRGEARRAAGPHRGEGVRAGRPDA